MKLAPRKKLLIIGISVLVVLTLVSAGLFYLKNNNDSGDTQKTVTLCVDDSIGGKITDDRSMLKLDAKDKLTPIADEIKLIEGHEKRAACLYPLLVNAIQKNEVASARQYYDQITVAYVEQGSYGAAVGLDAWPPEYFKTMVEDMEKRTEILNNFDLYEFGNPDYDLSSNPDYYPTEEELNEMGANNVQYQ
jgi:hypothetical protein